MNNEPRHTMNKPDSERPSWVMIDPTSGEEIECYCESCHKWYDLTKYDECPRCRVYIDDDGVIEVIEQKELER